MPRLSRPAEREPHDFAWRFGLAPGVHVKLFENSSPPIPVRSIDCHWWGDKNQRLAAVSFGNASMEIVSIALDRREAVLAIDIGSAEWTFSGPQYERGVTLERPLIVPARQSFSPSLYLLPGLPPMLVTVHIGVVFRLRGDAITEMLADNRR